MKMLEMADMMREILADVAGKLARYGAEPEDIEDVRAAVKGLCWRWAESNALACIMEEDMKAEMGEERYGEWLRNMKVFERIEKKVAETLPGEWAEED